MKLAVIVVNYNDTSFTQKFVKEITEYKCVNRIVVVDNASTDVGSFETLKGLESDKVTVINSGENGGYNFGNNFGINYLKQQGEEYDYYAISNPDIEIPEDSIKAVLSFLEQNKNIAVCSPRMLNGKGEPIRRSAWKERTPARDMIHSSRILEALFYPILREGEYSEEDFAMDKLKVYAVSGSFFIIKSHVYEEIGGFDENVFLFYEEDILAKQLEQRNYDTYCLNNVTFRHYESQTIGKTFTYYKKMKKMYISKMYYLKTYTKINKFQVLIFKLLRGIRIIELLFEIPIRKILGK